MIPFAIDVDMSFFGFPSHIVYYTVLIRGPCWLFLYIHLHLLISHCPSHHLSPSVTMRLLCYVVRPFLFGKKFLYIHMISYHMILVFLCLTSLIMILSTFFLVAGHGMMSPFLRLSCNCSVCLYASCLPIHLCLPTQASSMYWLLYIMLPWTLGASVF